MTEHIPVRTDNKLLQGKAAAKKMLETCLIQTVISNVELCQLGSMAGNLNQATGSEVKVFDKV